MRPAEVADARQYADEAIDLIVCPIEDAREALTDVAGMLRIGHPWVAEGSAPDSDPPHAVMNSMRGALSRYGVRLDRPIDGPTGQFRRLTFLKPGAEQTLYRAQRIRDAMSSAWLSGRLSWTRPNVV